MAITEIAQGQSYAARLGKVADEGELEKVLAKLDSAILDLEDLRDKWRRLSR